MTIPRRDLAAPLSVHVLSEFVFCHRAAVIAWESGGDSGDEEPRLGPRLDWWVDYDERWLTEELQHGWNQVWLWSMLLAVSGFVVFCVWLFSSTLAAIVAGIPVLFCAAKLVNTFRLMFEILRVQRRYHVASGSVDNLAPTEISLVSWWSLRKSGFDCQRLKEPLTDPTNRLTGKPWRVLHSGNALAVPVIRRQRGKQDWGQQHCVRLAAYAQLLEECESRSVPFGLILLAGTDQCVVIPITQTLRTQANATMLSATEFLEVVAGEAFLPAPPTDNRCRGCPFGRPRQYRENRSESMFNGRPAPPYLSKVVSQSSETTPKRELIVHCDCGDRFRWVPPHDKAKRLGISR